MKSTTLRVWDETPQNTRNIKLITKLSDLGSPMSRKSILGFYINLRQEAKFDSLNKAYHFIEISYRDNSSSEFLPLTSFFGKPFALQPQSMYIEKILTNPIKNLNNVQLKIIGIIKGKFSINDFGLLYRKYREISADTHDEE